MLLHSQYTKAHVYKLSRYDVRLFVHSFVRSFVSTLPAWHAEAQVNGLFVFHCAGPIYGIVMIINSGQVFRWPQPPKPSKFYAAMYWLQLQISQRGKQTSPTTHTALSSSETRALRPAIHVGPLRSPSPRNLYVAITSAYVYGTQEEPHRNRGRNGGPQCLHVKLQCIPLMLCARESYIYASDSANVTAWSCLNVNRLPSSTSTLGHS